MVGTASEGDKGVRSAPGCRQGKGFVTGPARTAADDGARVSAEGKLE